MPPVSRPLLEGQHVSGKREGRVGWGRRLEWGLAFLALRGFCARTQ